MISTFLAERYERKSIMITSNLVLASGTKFKDPMSATAIDHLVHYSTILEL